METQPNEPIGQTPAATDASGAGGTPAQADLLEKISRATDRAIEQHNAERKRKPGERGPDKGPRKKKISVAFVGDGSDSPLLAPDQAPVDSPAWEGGATPLDEETAKALAEVAVELFKDGRENLVRFAAYRITGDMQVASAAVSPMSEKLQAAMTKSGAVCLKKWGASIEHAPELTFLGAMLICVGGDFLKLRMLRAEMSKRKPGV